MRWFFADGLAQCIGSILSDVEFRWGFPGQVRVWGRYAGRVDKQHGCAAWPNALALSWHLSTPIFHCAGGLGGFVSPLNPVYSEQYHFFLEDGSVIALRYFKTATFEHYSAWWSDNQGNSRELINTSENRSSTEHISIQKNEQTGTIDLPEARLTINFEVATQFTWDVPGEENHHAVIHQPKLLCTVHQDDNIQTAIGYCKIYQGNYPKFWGYYFVHAFFPDYGIIWSANAKFGEENTTISKVAKHLKKHKTYSYKEKIPNIEKQAPTVP